MATSMTLPETFFNPKQAREKANHSGKKKKTRVKGKGKKNLISAHAWAKMS